MQPWACRRVSGRESATADGRFLRSATLVVVAAAIVSVAPGSGGQAPTRLAFVVAETDVAHSATDIFVATLDGRSTNITSSALAEYAPHWSPSGRQIAFDAGSVGGLDSQIFVMDPTGRHRRRLTGGGRQGDFSDFGAWSPDGRRIAFSRSIARGDHPHEIYVMEADGSHKRRLTNNKVDDSSPYWSPDGRQIVFMRESRDTTYDVYVVAAWGGKERRLTRFGDTGAEAWAPGRQIVVTRSSAGTGAGSASGIYVINGDGTGLRRVKKNRPDNDFEVASWSPDRSSILYYGLGVATVRVRDGRVKRLTRNERDWDAVWSPDGRRIAFVRGVAIWIMNRDGSGMRQVTRPRGQNEHRWPTWSLP
jgi:Tol biopolymer transport system component